MEETTKAVFKAKISLEANKGDQKLTEIFHKGKSLSIILFFESVFYLLKPALWIKGCLKGLK